MKTNREIIYDYKNFLDAQELSDEVGSSNRYIYNHLLNFRANLLKQKRINSKLSDLNYQTINFISLEEVNDVDGLLNCSPDMECTLLRTVTPIPTFIELKSITSPNNTSGEIIKYTEINPDMIKWKSYSQFSSQSNSSYYFLRNQKDGVYIYLWNKNGILDKGVSINGIFYQPHLIEAINDCDGNLDSCYNYLEAKFPIDPELLTTLYQLSINTLLKAKLPITDTSNDGLNSNVQNQQSNK